MKKRKVIITISIILIIVLIIVALFISYLNREKTSIDDFSSVKELVEYDGHEYINTVDSEEDGFEKDIYIVFSVDDLNDDGTTNQDIYEIVISHVAGKMAGTNFRLIDEEKGIIVRIKYNGEEVSVYTINGDANYWDHIQTSYQIDNYESIESNVFTVKSTVLSNIINNSWIYKNVSLGTKDSEIDNYEVYFDEGYKIRKIGSEIYNIIFTSNYISEVLENITIGMSFEEIEEVLGEPTYIDDDGIVIGYVCEDFYIFFSDGEISIYSPDKYREEDSQEFGTLMSDLNSTGDTATFLNKLTDLYSDYETYYQTSSYVYISYPLRGFTITFGATSNNGLTVYANYHGYITESVTIDDLINDKQMPANVYTNLDTNLVFETEIGRVYQDSDNRNPLRI